MVGETLLPKNAMPVKKPVQTRRLMPPIFKYRMLTTRYLIKLRRIDYATEHLPIPIELNS